MNVVKPGESAAIRLLDGNPQRSLGIMWSIRGLLLLQQNSLNRKKSSFRSFAQSINIKENPSYGWNTCKIFENSWVNNGSNNKKINENLNDQV